MHMDNGTLCLTPEEQEALNFAVGTDPARRGFYANIPVRVTQSEPGPYPENIVAYAKTGIIALIDETTGKQDDRPKNFLARKYKEYLNG